jgi:hypothetical protein
MERDNVFRYHEGKAGEDWFTSQVYGESEITGIQDPTGGSGRSEITSIPSTFARLDLVITAFKFVVENKTLDGNTIYHKMVSDALDIGEIFFNIETLQDKIRIIPWSKKEDLSHLFPEETKNTGHNLLGETYGLYLQQDFESYNFDKLNRLFLLECKDGLPDRKIIGGTSPATLFFSSANDLKFVDISFGNRKLFYYPGENEKNYVYPALWKRDPEYQRYLNHFFITYPDITLNTHEGLENPLCVVKEYLKLNLAELSKKGDSRNLVQEISNLTPDTFSLSFTELNTGKEGDIVDVCGKPMKKLIPLLKRIEKVSDFVIRSDKFKGTKPLVLQNDYAKPLKYTTDLWISNTQVPFHPLDEEGNLSDYKERQLPSENRKYPWLTVSDFLEPYVTKLFYQVNNHNYFTGINSSSTHGYTLPLKKLFFDFFDPSDLKLKHKDGKSWFEMQEEVGGGLTVKLRVPISKDNEYITFERTYYPSANENEIPKPDLQKNKGIIVNNQFSIFIFPNIKINSSEISTHFRIGLIDRDIHPLTRNNEYQLKFYQSSNNNEISNNIVKTRSDKKLGNNLTSKYYILKDEFDYIEVQNAHTKSIIIPNFKNHNRGSDEFVFAIDFGTTYTHIEYRKNNGAPVPFEIRLSETQVATYHNSEIVDVFGDAPEILSWITMEFLPENIYTGHDYQFPQRTVVGYDQSLDFDQETYSLADFNVPFIYDKDSPYSNIRLRTNLKWSNYIFNSTDIKSVRAFMESLIFLIRNKVLFNGGDLSKTKIIWSYPCSMIPQRRDKLQELLKEIYKDYFGPKSTENILTVSESIAPFYYYTNKLQVHAGVKPGLSIDIGGETVDLVIFKEGKPLCISSFRFGANFLFGDGYSGASGNNGFILKYAPKFLNLLTSSKYTGLVKLLTGMIGNDNSADIAAFFFSLEQNKKIIDKSGFSFNKMLSNDSELKIIFLVYYLSIIYHSAKLMLASGFEAPEFITFSGTASKVLDILDTSKEAPNSLIANDKSFSIIEFNRLPDLTKLVFERVYGKKIDRIIIRSYAEPKEISAKGALYSEFKGDIEDLKSVLLGTDKDVILNKKKLFYKNITKNNKARLEVVKEIFNFFDLVFDLDKEFSYNKYFGIELRALVNSKKLLLENIEDFLRSGIEKKLKEIPEELQSKVEIEETLFFYPLIGALNGLAMKLVTKKPNEE